MESLLIKVAASLRLRGVLRLLAVTLGLLTMSACGGGWGGSNGLKPTITTQPVSQTVTAGQTATFTVTATGTGPLSYQWYKGGVAISGATSSSYTTPAIASSDNGSSYTVVVSNEAGTVASAPATLTVSAAPVPPAITTQPVSQTVTAGQTATFTVAATGTGPLSYQWYQGGVAISGATSSSYTTPATAIGNSGASFTVIVSNAVGTVTSAPATLTVSAAPVPPAITTQPVSQTVTVGQTATLNVTATGDGPLNYQWYKNGVAISGATSSSYTTPATAIGNSGSSFTVVVSNAAGTVTSTPAILTVNNTTPVASGLVCSPTTPPYNSSATLVPTFSGGTAVVGSSGVGSSDITASAVSGSSYATPALTSAKTYTLTVTGTGGAVASTTCTVTPTSVSISAVSPANQTIAPGQQTFTAAAIGGLTNQVTWSASGGSFNGNVWTSPTTPGTYIITATSVDNPSVSTTTTVIVSTSLPVITAQPASQNVCTNGSTTLSVSANFANSYQWNLNGSPLPGATSSTYFIPSAISIDAGNYTVTVTNAVGSVTSSVAKVVVGSSITSNPTSLSIFVTQTATFSVSVTGVSPFSYQWYAIPPASSTGVAIPGATSSTYTTPAAALTANGSQYYATVTEACGVLTSAPATLTVTSGNVPPTITTQPVGQTVAVGGTTTFSVTASGTPGLSYQWYRVPAGSVTGTAISGATSASYTVPNTATTTSNDQDKYYAVVTNPYGQAVSEKAPLAVGNGIMLQIIDQPKTVYVNEGAPATFTVTATSNLPLTYQWYKAPPGSSTFTAISGATSATYTLDSTATTDTGSVFYAVVSNGVTSSVTSSSASLFVGDLSGVSNLCNTAWTAIGSAIPLSACSFQLTSATANQHGEIVWPTLISTGNIQLGFTVTISNPSTPPADGFAIVLGDPSLGATLSSQGATGKGLGAQGIPGFVLAFDTYYNAFPTPSDPPVPYLGVGRGETALWENPWFNVNSKIPALATVGSSVSHDYTVSIVQGKMTVTMDGVQVFSGSVSVPPVAYFYVTSSTGASYEQTVISNLSATVSVPSN
jgi:hypothetical protein